MEREEWLLGIRGKTGVGSLSFIVQFVQNHFITMDPTTYMDDDSYRKQISVDDTVCVIDLNVMRLYEDEHQWGSKVWWAQDWARRIQGCILAYSQADRSSFDEIPKYIDQIMRIKEVNAIEQFIPIIIIETKCDLNAQYREVSIEEGQALARQYNAPFFSTSAKYRTNIEETVHELVRLCRKRRDDAMQPQKKKKVKPVKPVKKVITTSTIVIPQPNSTLVADIQEYLLDVEKYSDLVLKVGGDRNIYVHKAILFSRSPSFMEKIKPVSVVDLNYSILTICQSDKVMDLSTLDYSAVLNIMKYLYTGKFQREDVINDLYKPAINKLQVYNLLPILKQDNVVIEGFDPKFERLFNLNFSSDLKIIVKESKKSEREIYCHKMILCARSAYFRTMYHGGFKESDAAELIVDDCSYDAILFLIRYYYLDVKQIDNESIVCDVLRIAHMYDERPVIQVIESYLQTHLSTDTVCFVLMLCDLYSLSQLLKSACEEFISYRFKKVSKTSAFKKLTPERQKQLESSQKEGPWAIPESDSGSTVLLKLFKSFKL